MSIHVGMDLGCDTSIACTHESESLYTSTAVRVSNAPPSVLFPLIRRERIVAGASADEDERGSSIPWPPLAGNALSPRLLPYERRQGRVLLSEAWQRLLSGNRWETPTWSPPDDLPRLPVPSPVDCLNAEIKAAKEKIGNPRLGTPLALAISNRIPEESQEALLKALPADSHLIWRSVAAAMAWSQSATQKLDSRKLTVIDVHPDGVEVSCFTFRTVIHEGKSYNVPIRKTDNLRYTAFPQGLETIPPDASFRNLLNGRSLSIPHELNSFRLITGLSAARNTKHLREYGLDCEPFSCELVAKGTSLFLYRHIHGLPTYLDTLQSLELFILTPQGEPAWVTLIPHNQEIAGGQAYQQRLEGEIYIEKGSEGVCNWLQRSGEKAFRKLTTEFPIIPKQNAQMDLSIHARSAGGFAQVIMKPSSGEPEVFGPSRSVLLDWTSMETLERKPEAKWPIEIKYGWPATGKLYAHRDFFNEFISLKEDLEDAITSNQLSRLGSVLRSLKHISSRVIAPKLVGIDSKVDRGAPANQLVCFGTTSECEFMGSDYSGNPKIHTPLPSSLQRAIQMGEVLFKIYSELPSSRREERALIFYILGRMGGCAPHGFKSKLKSVIVPTAKQPALFAAGRVLNSEPDGATIFDCLHTKHQLAQTLNNNWIKLIVYITFQHELMLKDVSRQQLSACMELCINALKEEINQRRFKILFMNSLRAIALLLRARKFAGAKDFLIKKTCPRTETSLHNQLSFALDRAELNKLPSAAKELIELLKGWLAFSATTDVLPPIATQDDEEDSSDDND